MGRKLGAVSLWGGELGHNVARAKAYLHAKFHLDPSNRLATVHERHRQTDRTGQRTDSIGRTVLQTIAPKNEARAMRQLRIMLECLCDGDRR